MSVSASESKIRIGVDSPYKLKHPNRTVIEETVRHDGVHFYTVRFPVLDSVPLRGKLLILHGYCEHSLMYYRIMESLTCLGYECLTFDQRGSGRTSLGKLRGIVGYPEDSVLWDVDKMIEVLWEQDNSPLKFGLVAHSMGGGIALKYLSQGKYRNIINSCCLVSPLILPSKILEPNPLILFLGNVFSYIFPNIRIGKTTTTNADKFKIVTASPEWQDYLNSEILCRDGGTLGQMCQMLRRGSSLAKNEFICNPEIKILVLQSRNDQIVSTEAVEQFYDKIQVYNKQYVSVDGGHALFIESEETYDIVLRCLEKFYQLEG
ncbi:Alpha/Beta hydrolase protein [Scheffersomyces xylosifermentans]|uniref:Alpha/Beta hydrolase protein n=1 Tax=Scheffersomyces xylosifermentans TaxID=1304137 RepID=UPI00315D7EF7